MKRAIGNPTKSQQAYQDALRALGCAVCAWRIAQGMQVRMQGGPVHIHHRNLDDKHGQRQIGHHAVVALCAWHHDGDQLPGKTQAQMRALFGPSFKHHARDFREWTADVLPGYGRGTEAWQRWQDEQLERGGKAA